MTALLPYLFELRTRLLHCSVALALCFLLVFVEANSLFHALATPLIKYLPKGQSLIALGITTSLIVPIKLAFYVALLLTMPYLLYQLWAFLAPALYKRERSLLWLILFPSVGLFYLGIAFAYFVIFPILFRFFTTLLPPGVVLMPDMGQYLSFTLRMLVAFGVSFQVPVIMLVLRQAGLFTIEQFILWRPYIIVAAFIIGMLLTPPDVVSQIALAIPLCLLYEIGVLLARFVKA